MIRRIVALSVLACASTVAVVPGHAYTAKLEPPFLCNLEGEAAARAASESMSPPSGTTVVAGSPVSFSAESRWPLTFAVAASPALLSTPDIDSGPGALQSTGSSPENAPLHTYTFTSTKATATPGTIYWAASVSSNTIPICAGLPAKAFSTSAHTLTVLPATSVPSTPTMPLAPSAPPTVLALVGRPRVDPKGATFTVICEAPAGQSCEGNGALSSTERLSGKRVVGLSAKRSSTKRVAIGETTFTAAAGQTKAVVVALNGTAHNLLDRFGGVPVTLTVTLTNGAAGERTAVANHTFTIVSLDTARVAKAIELSLLSQRHIRAKVTCPVGVIQVKGNKFTCIATSTVGKGKHKSREQTHLEVTQVDDEGHVNYGAV